MSYRIEFTKGYNDVFGEIMQGLGVAIIGGSYVAYTIANQVYLSYLFTGFMLILIGSALKYMVIYIKK